MDVSRLSDEDLVPLVRGGDKQAAAVLFQRFGPLLRAKAGRQIAPALQRRVGESDVMQETFLAAFGSLAEFEDRGPGSFRTWIERILDHKAGDAFRRYVEAGKRSLNRETPPPSTVAREGPAGSAPSPSAHAVRGEQRLELERAMRELSGADRLIMDLVHERGMSFEEAGRLMDRSAGAARKLYGRVLLRLAKRLKELA